MIGSFFAEFDDHKGPVVVFDEPEGLLLNDEGRRLWESFSDYVLSGNPLLDGRIIQVRAGSASVVSLPVVLLDDEKYRRNAMFFSIGVTVPSEALEACAAFCRAPLLRLGRALRAMELEDSILSKGRDEKDDRERVQRLSRVLPLALKILASAAARAANVTQYDQVSLHETRSHAGFVVRKENETHNDDDPTLTPSYEVISLRETTSSQDISVSKEENNTKSNDDNPNAITHHDEQEPKSQISIVSKEENEKENEDDPNLISLRWTQATITLAPRTLGSPRAMHMSKQVQGRKIHQGDDESLKTVQQWEVPVLLVNSRGLLNVGSNDDAAHSHRFSDAPFRGDDSWDLAVQQVAPYVDGIRNVKQLSQRAHVDVLVAVQALRVLKSYGCLAFIDVFQYSNIYRATARTTELSSRRDALDACADFVFRISPAELKNRMLEEVEDREQDKLGRRKYRSLSRSSENLSSTADSRSDHLLSKEDEDGLLAAEYPAQEPEQSNAAALSQTTITYNPVSLSRLPAENEQRPNAASDDIVFENLLRLFCAFADGRTVGDILLSCQSDILVEQLDHRAFAAYGALHGILVRVHRFPAALDPNRNYKRPKFLSTPKKREKPAEKNKKKDDGPVQTPLDRTLELMDGNHCMDEICTELQMSISGIVQLVTEAGYEIRDIYR